MTKLKDIVFETDHYWVKRVPKGFEVYKTGLTHSTRVAVIGYVGAKGLQRAKAEITRREGAVSRHATKTAAQLDREIATLTGVMTAREVNAIVRATDGRNVYLHRNRMGVETVHRVTQARRRDRVMEVHDLSTGRWLPVMPELGDKLEVR